MIHGEWFCDLQSHGSFETCDDTTHLIGHIKNVSFNKEDEHWKCMKNMLHDCGKKSSVLGKIIEQKIEFLIQSMEAYQTHQGKRVIGHT